jgi:hypothetical protein
MFLEGLKYIHTDCIVPFSPEIKPKLFAVSRLRLVIAPHAVVDQLAQLHNRNDHSTCRYTVAVIFIIPFASRCCIIAESLLLLLCCAHRPCTLSSEALAHHLQGVVCHDFCSTGYGLPPENVTELP